MIHRDIVWTTQFKKDYKLAVKRHLGRTQGMSYPPELAADLPH